MVGLNILMMMLTDIKGNKTFGIEAKSQNNHNKIENSFVKLITTYSLNILVLLT